MSSCNYYRLITDLKCLRNELGNNCVHDGRVMSATDRNGESAWRVPDLPSLFCMKSHMSNQKEDKDKRVCVGP